MNIDANAIIVAIVGSGLLSTIVTQVFSAINRRKEAASGVNEAMRLVLKDRLRFLAIHYIEQGWIYDDELADILDMHRCYHDKLKGNGYLDTLMAKVKNLPVRGVGHH